MMTNASGIARTAALRRALTHVHDIASINDLLFLEAWELRPDSTVAATLRAHQLRRANPELAAEIRAEVSQARSARQREPVRLAV